jgi:hypothetical protein
MSDDEVVYNDEANYISWLKLVQLVQFDMVIDPDDDAEVEFELDRRAVGFNPNDEVVVWSDEGLRSIDAEPDTEVSQHDWVSAHVRKKDGSIRDEFLPQTNSLLDRPTENDKFGLPGLRYIEKPDKVFFSLNVECPSCHIFTPSVDDACQNCESNLISI